MGTNFYWTDAVRDAIDDYTDGHIGKRSAAGAYCWDCDLTLCASGTDAIHHGRGAPGEFHEACPHCMKPFIPGGITSGAAAVELGFAKPNTERPQGVSSASSFTWAKDPESVGVLCERYANDPVVIDEYGREMTGTEFLLMLRMNCPIQFTNMIGEWFS